MTWIEGLFRRLWSMLLRGRLEGDLIEELRFHLESEVEKNIKAGMTPEEARYAALRSFGGVEQVKEECRDVRGVRFIEEIWQDIRYSTRMLRKSPGFTAVATSILALGIGANGVVFSFLHALLLRPLPFKDPHRIAAIWEIDPQGQHRDVSSANFIAWQNKIQSFEQVAAYRGMDTILTGRDYADQLMGARVTQGLLPLLGARPALGRAFLESDYESSAESVAIISHSLWQRRFDSDPQILGKTLALDRQQYTIVGVMPPQFWFWTAGDPNDVCVPLRFTPAELTQGGSQPVHVFGRIRHGMGLKEAQAEMELKIRDLVREFPKLYSGWNVKVVSLRDWHEQYQSAFLGMLMALPFLLGAVSLVQLIACANVASLALARGLGKRKEMAIRTALGAGRSRLVRQLLVESVLLSGLGGAFGLLLAFWGVKLSLTLVPDEIQWILPGGKETIGIDAPVMAFMLIISTLTGLVFGLVPALRTSRVNFSQALKEGGRTAGTEGTHHEGRALLVVFEIATSLVLLVGASLMLKSLVRLLKIDVGFNPEHVVAMLMLSQPDSPHDANFYKQILQQVGSLPGVESTCLMNNIPAGEFWLSGEEFAIEGRPVTETAGAPQAITTLVDPVFFQAMGVSLLRGRIFTEHDSRESPGVAVISRSLAERYFPGEDALGKRIRPGGIESKKRWLSIIGIVGNVQHKLSPEPVPTLYKCYLQQDIVGDMTLYVRTPLPPAEVVSSIRKEVWKIDKEQAITYFWTMEHIITASMFVARFITWLLGSYAVLALILSLMGIYGVVSYSVSQKTHEIGVRMALGAPRDTVLRLFLKRAFLLATTGVGIGVVGALAVTRVLNSQLYGVPATDLLTFAGVSLLLLSVAMLASYIPARRATKVDPMVALRHE
jgi:putative ABC transport system permease protein